MNYAYLISTILITALLSLINAGVYAYDETLYPDMSSQWIRIGPAQWDPSKPPGLAQQAPLTPEYQAIYNASLAAQAAGGLAMI